MRYLAVPLVAVVFVGVPRPATADPDLVLVSAEDAPVALEEVRALLIGELPDLQIVTDTIGTDPSGVARVTVARWADGRLAVSYRDASGRETVRLVEAGARPESTVAMIVVNLQQDQLDAVLGPTVRSVPPRESRARPARRLRATVRPSASKQDALALRAGLGLMNRSLEVEVSGSDAPRAYAAPAFPTFAVDATALPARLLGDRGFLSGLGIGLSFRRALAIETNGPNDLGETIAVDTVYQDVAAALLFEAPLSEDPRAPRVRISAGWSTVAFELDPVSMSLLRAEIQVPSFVYEGLATDLRLDVPIGQSSVTAHGAAGIHFVTDVGQPVRDLYGADTTGAVGYRAEVGLDGTLVGKLRWATTFEIRQLETEVRGASSAGSGRIDEFTAASDRYVAGQLALGYHTD